MERSFITFPFCACWDRAGDRVKLPLWVVVMYIPVAADTVGPELVLVMLEQSLE